MKQHHRLMLVVMVVNGIGSITESVAGHETAAAILFFLMAVFGFVFVL